MKAILKEHGWSPIWGNPKIQW